MPGSILVPVDGSNFAEHALPYALGIARRTGARLYLALVHVPSPTASPSHPLAEALAEHESLQRDFDAAYLERLVQRLRPSGVRVHPALLSGRVAPALARFVEDQAIDLVILTTHGRGGLQRAWLGSTADSLVRRLTIPMLLVRPSEDTRELDASSAVMFRHVLAALDGNRAAENALAEAVELGVAGDAAITLANVVQPPIMAYSPYLPHTVQLSQDEVAAQRDSMSRYLADLEDAPWLRQRRVTGVVRVDFHPATAILDLAEQTEADLIVMATHGRGGVRRLILGSVADKVIRGSHRPVLVHHGPRSEDWALATTEWRATEPSETAAGR